MTGTTALEKINTIDWTTELELQLLCAMRGHKPVGLNRHFQMICIYEKLRSSAKDVDVTVQNIWDHLDTMYDMQALDDCEPMPFPNHEFTFNLPDDEFGDLMKNVKMAEIKAKPAPPTAEKEKSKNGSSKSKDKHSSLSSDDTKSRSSSDHISTPKANGNSSSSKRKSSSRKPPENTSSSTSSSRSSTPVSSHASKRKR